MNPQPRYSRSRRGLAALTIACALLLGPPAAMPAPTLPPLPPGAQVTDGPPIGSIAEQFALPDTSGQLVRLSDLQGGGGDQPAVTMLNFWAFWCDTWNAEMPFLRELSQHRNDLDFRMAAVSVDGARLPEFLRVTRGGAHVPFPVLLDSGGRVSARYNIHHVPTVILLDRQGHVRYRACGYPGNEVVLNQIRTILNQDAIADGSLPDARLSIHQRTASRRRHAFHNPRQVAARPSRSGSPATFPEHRVPGGASS